MSLAESTISTVSEMAQKEVPTNIYSPEFSSGVETWKNVLSAVDNGKGFEYLSQEIEKILGDSQKVEGMKNAVEEVEQNNVESTGEKNEGAEVSETVENLHDDYMDDIKNNSEYPDTIEDNGSDYEKLSPEENAEKRAEFNANKEKLIKEWEERYGKEWPRYKEDLYMNGKLIRRAGDRYDAHHVKPLGLGGKNEASNLTPISAEKHFDKQGVHAPDSPYAKLENYFKEQSK